MLATLIKLVNPKPRPAAKAAATPARQKTPSEVYRRGPGTSGPDKTELELAKAKMQFKLAALAQAKAEARKK
jgi:hypothetical protein